MGLKYSRMRFPILFWPASNTLPVAHLVVGLDAAVGHRNLLWASSFPPFIAPTNKHCESLSRTIECSARSNRRTGDPVSETSIGSTRSSWRRDSAPGAIDTRQSGIGIGEFAKESIPARSEKRDFNAWERAEINRIGQLYGCHTCGARDPRTISGNFVLDHQRPNSVNTPGEQQRLFPQCLTCSSRQGGRLSREVDQ
jgi:hypothetical protein